MEEGKRCKTIELRSGKELSYPYKVPKADIKKQNETQSIKTKNEDGWVEV